MWKSRRRCKAAIALTWCGLGLGVGLEVGVGLGVRAELGVRAIALTALSTILVRNVTDGWRAL